jgi:hypothetical protein
VKIALFELNPFCLWSLMDLLRVYAEEYIEIGEHISTLMDWLGSPMNDEAKGLFKDLLIQLKDHCVTLNLVVSSELLIKAIADLPQGERELTILIDAVKAEIKSKMFLFIPSQRAKYYDWSLPLELQVYSYNSSKELLRAGKCYAKGEFTACVFHSMRAAEIGLRSLATHLNVTFPFPIDLADWHNLIDSIGCVIKKAGQQPKSATKDKELKFCSAAASQFRYFKEAYRKHVSHARETYNEEEALSIMERTAEFIKGLSGKISEPEP